jgi:biopolymer transport protein ExbD
MSEINVTPFVDVMLVLLVIFMVSAPMIVSGISVDLPSSSAGPLTVEEKPLAITVTGDGGIFIDDVAVDRAGFSEALAQAASGSADPAKRAVLLRADQSLGYGLVVGIIGNVTRAGFLRVSLVSVVQPDPVIVS